MWEEFYRPLTKGQPVAPRSRLAKVVCALVVALFALVGCAGQPGAAALVDGRAISERTLSETTVGMDPFLDGQAGRSVVLDALIQAPFAVQVASEHGLAVSTDQTAEFLDEQLAMREVAAPTEGHDAGVVSLTRYLLLLGQIDQDERAGEIHAAIAERVSAADVQVSPRYGEWVPGQGPVPTSPEWLLTPEVAPA